jgi:ABC-type amino acid transport substrate-binding protein
MTILRRAGKQNTKNNVLAARLQHIARGLFGCVFAIGLGVSASLAGANEVRSDTAEVGQADLFGDDRFLILQTNLHPPYQELQNGLLSGYSISVLNCVFDRIGVGYGLAVAPRQRNREMVRSGQADGFFLARISDVMDEYAVASNPLALEKWVWVSSSNQTGVARENRFPKPGDFSTVGAILGSNEAEWLAEQGFVDIMRVPSIGSLVSQLEVGRVDYVLVDKHSFELARDDLGHASDQFVLQFERYAPLVVYFSKRYMSESPDMLDRLNGVLEYCETRPMHLESWERDAIERVQLPIVRQFAQSEELIANVRWMIENATHLNKDQVRLFDEEWKAGARAMAPSKLAQEVLDNVLSDYLRTFQISTGEQVAEAFVFDVRGQIIGMNRLTSDFDQSDEAQFQMTQSINRDHALIADIRFDGSTHSFLSQITVPIVDPETGLTLAALTVGLDVSAALRPES